MPEVIILGFPLMLTQFEQLDKFNGVPDDNIPRMLSNRIEFVNRLRPPSAIATAVRPGEDEEPIFRIICVAYRR